MRAAVLVGEDLAGSIAAGTGARLCAGPHSPALARGDWIPWPRLRWTWRRARLIAPPGGVTSSPDLPAAASSVLRAEDIPALLGAAYRAFECALQALRGAEDRAGPLLPAFVLAAAEAANGRDAVAAAGSFPGPGAVLAEAVTSLAVTDVADQVAELSLALSTRLRGAETRGGGSACAAAAAYAGRMHELLAPPG